jgi:hypothetical protein
MSISKLAIVSVSMLAAPALASELLIGTVTSTGGASANIQVPRGAKIAVQCDAAFRYRPGAGSGTAVANSGATKGLMWDVAPAVLDVLMKPSEDYIAIIPATGTATLTCDVFRREP